MADNLYQSDGDIHSAGRPFRIPAEQVANLPEPYQWLQGGRFAADDINQSIPSGVYVPVHWGQVYTDEFQTRPTYTSTTITAASDAQVLTTAGPNTIEVADASVLETPGTLTPKWLVIRDMSASPNIFQIVKYTGISIGTGAGGVDQITGCSLSNLTLATGDTVRQAEPNVFSTATVPPYGADSTYLFQMVVALCWASSSAGPIRRVRYNAIIDFAGTPLDLVVFQNDNSPIDAPAEGQFQQLTGQPGIGAGPRPADIIEVYQDTASNLNLLRPGIHAPIIMQSAFTAREA